MQEGHSSGVKTATQTLQSFASPRSLANDLPPPTRFVASSNLTGGFFVSAGNGDNVLTVFYRVAAQINGLVLSAYELEFTKKIVGVAAVDGVDCGANTNNSEGIDEEDKKAHDELMRTMQNGGGGEERCKGCCVT